MNNSLPPTDGALCAEYRAVVHDLLADEADAVTVARLEAHTALCTGCRFALAQARAYRRTMRRVGQSARAPSTLRHHAVDLTREHRGSRGSHG